MKTTKKKIATFGHRSTQVKLKHPSEIKAVVNFFLMCHLL